MGGVSNRFKWVATAVVFAAAVFDSRASNASIVYADLTGTHVQYLAPTEDSATDALPLYGPPSVTDDSLTFNPTNFAAQSINGAAPDITDGRFFTTIASVGSARIAHIILNEAGDYTLLGNGNASTGVSVSAPGFFRITQLDGVGITPIQVNFNESFIPNGGSYSLPGNAGSGVIWSGSLDVDIDAAIAAAGQTGRATQVILDMDNVLTAFSQVGTIAKIQKKTVNDIAITPVVPEPGSAALLTLVASALIARCRGRA